MIVLRPLSEIMSSTVVIVETMHSTVMIIRAGPTFMIE